MIQTLITDYYSFINNNKRILKYKQSQQKITKYFEKKRKFNNRTNGENNLKQNKIYGFNTETESWHCLECGIDMGYSNPRQLCKKFYCGNFF